MPHHGFMCAPDSREESDGNMAQTGWRMAHGAWWPTTSTLVVDTYPSFNANHKNDKKQSKTRAAAKLAKIAKFNAQDKASLRIQRKKAQKEISKSRDNKRKLKSTEAGITNVPEGIQYNQREISIEDEAQKKEFEARLADRELQMEMEWIKREKKAGRFVPIPKNFEIIRRANERSAKR